MRWVPEPEPAINTIRVVRRFALWPTPLDDGTTIWLEPYRVRERLVSVWGFPEPVIQWATEERYATAPLTGRKGAA